MKPSITIRKSSRFRASCSKLNPNLLSGFPTGGDSGNDRGSVSIADLQFLAVFGGFSLFISIIKRTKCNIISPISENHNSLNSSVIGLNNLLLLPKLLIPLSQFSELGGRLPLGNIEGFFEEELLNRDFLLATHWYTSLNQTSLSQLFSLGGVEER